MIRIVIMVASMPGVVGQLAGLVQLLAERRRLDGDGHDQLAGQQAAPGERPALLQAGEERRHRGGQDHVAERGRSPWRPSCGPARSRFGGMWSTPEMRPLATDGAAPSTTTKVIADSLSLNSTMASGNQAMEGIVCRPVIIEPMAERNGLKRDDEAADDHADHDGEEEPPGPASQRDRRWPPSSSAVCTGPPRGAWKHLAGAGQDELAPPAAPHDQLPDGERDGRSRPASAR